MFLPDNVTSKPASVREQTNNDLLPRLPLNLDGIRKSRTIDPEMQPGLDSREVQ